MAAPDEGPTPEPDHGLSQAPNQNSNQKNQTTDHEPNQTLNQTLDQELNQTATQSSNHGSTSDSNQDPAGFLRRPIDPNFPIRDVDLSDPTFTSDGQAQELQTDDISYYLHHLSWEFRLPGYAATLGKPYSPFHLFLTLTILTSNHQALLPSSLVGFPRDIYRSFDFVMSRLNREFTMTFMFMVTLLVEVTDCGQTLPDMFFTSCAMISPTAIARCVDGGGNLLKCVYNDTAGEGQIGRGMIKTSAAMLQWNHSIIRGCCYLYWRKLSLLVQEE